MKNSFLKDITSVFNSNEKVHLQFIVVNISIFILLNIINLIVDFTNSYLLFEIKQWIFFIPAKISDFIYRPWTLITYSFAHEGLFHIVFNMLWLYWFGKIIIEYIGSGRFRNIFIYGAVMGAVLFLLAYNFIPFYIQKQPSLGMIGASAGVTAIVVGAATLLPNYTMNLLFFGPVKIMYIAVFQVIISFFNVSGSNAGGNLAHLGGAFIGFLFIKQLQNGTDLGKPLNKLINISGNIFSKRQNIKVSYKSKSSVNQSFKNVNQKEIDKILDKIAQSGYDSLTKEEKQLLFQASKN